MAREHSWLFPRKRRSFRSSGTRRAYIPVVLQDRNVIWDKLIRSNPTLIPKPAKSADEPSVTALKEAPVTTVKPTGEEIEVAQVVGRARLC